MAGRRINGEGTLTRRKDGRWCARTAAPERKAFYGRTAGEAIRRRAAYRRAPSIATVTADTPWKEYAAAWLASAKLKVRKNTADAYTSAVELHTSSLNGTPIGQIRPKQIQAVIDEVAAKAGRWLCVRVKSVIRLALQAAVDLEELPANPCDGRVKLPRDPGGKATGLDPEHARAFLRHIAGHRHEALVRLYLGAGLRRGEALGLTWAAIDWERGMIAIRQAVIEEGGRRAVAPLKTPGSDDVIPVGDDVLSALKERRRLQLEERLKAGESWTETGLVFTDRKGLPLWPREALRVIKRLMKDAGLPERYTIRSMRHTLATDLLQRVDLKTAQWVLRHKKAATTLDVYGDRPKDAADRARAAMNDAAKGRT